MGYDISYIRINTTPSEHIEGVVAAIDKVRSAPLKAGIWSGDASTYDIRWCDLTEDMRAISKSFPSTAIEVYVRGEGQDEWVEHFKNGKAFMDQPAAWEPPAFDESKLK